jgi:predicted O-methyltransferase YrrM
MVDRYGSKQVLELGTSLGITTAYLAMANTLAQVHTMEGAAAIAMEAEQNFRELGIANIRLVKGNFNQTLPNLLGFLPQVDLAFVDGNHKKEPTLQYFHQLLGKVKEGSILVFDDIHWSEGMEAAWDEIKKHEQVMLTVDLFFIGIVFFSSSFKVKQHFTIRF